MATEARIMADSVGPHGERLTTIEVTYPHFIHKEVMTHRVFSRNFMSMRAVPPEKIIQQVVEDPVVPEFHGRSKGMGTAGPLNERESGLARCQWLSARNAAVQAAKGMLLNDVAKSDVNPLLEPFLWMRGVISATDWDNFFALRCHPDARKEMQDLAWAMCKAMKQSDPRVLAPGEWHLPGLTDEQIEASRSTGDRHYWPLVSAGILARISFDNMHKEEDEERSHQRGRDLCDSGHWSPHEHPAMCLSTAERYGNFKGFRQYRKFHAFEWDFGALQDHAPTLEGALIA